MNNDARGIGSAALSASDDDGFRPLAAYTETSGIHRIAHQVFADHLLTFDDPAKQYDERMRPTTFDHVLRRFSIVLLVAIAAFFLFVSVVLFVSGAQ